MTHTIKQAERHFVGCALLLGSVLCSPTRMSGQKLAGNVQWEGSWGAAQQIPEPQNALPAADLQNATLREIVNLSTGGTVLRVHLSNVFGTSPLRLSGVHIARPLSPSGAAIDPGTDTALRFAGQPDVTIPAGAEYVSDPIAFRAAALSSLAITLHYDAAPQQQTGHPGSRSTSYYLHGDLLADPAMQGAKTVEHWYQISEVDVRSADPASAVVAFGDSITDGHGAVTNANNRWPDVLAGRLQASRAGASVGVLNAGIGGNRVLLDGLGPNALARFDRDVLARDGVRYVILFEGINDLGTLARTGEASQAQHDALVAHLLAAFSQMIDRAHAHGIRIYGATITPDGGSQYYHPGPISEADRAKINTWIRTAGAFDGVLDFDKVVRDPASPDHLLAAFDSGDHLHPSAAGYRAMADAIPLALFAKSKQGK